MIDWWGVFTNLLWIVGAATVLAILSHADWQASAQGKVLRARVRRVARNPGFALGMMLVCLGAGLSVLQGWQRVLWLLLAITFAIHAGWAWLGQREGPPGE